MPVGRQPFATLGRAGLVALLSAAAASAGCARDPDLTAPVTTGPVVIESFVGTVPVGGSAFYSFTVTQTGVVTLTLLSLTVDGAASDLTVNVGVGTPSGTTCQASTTTAVGVGVTPQQTTQVTGGIYCAIVSDIGTLTDPASFALNISRPR